MNSISFNLDDELGYRIFLNDEDCSSFISYEKKVELWKIANEKLEKDVNKIAEKYKTKKHGEFVWCFTWEPHRNDGLLGTPYFYYTLEIIEYLLSVVEVSKISIHRAVPRQIFLFIKDKYSVEVEYRKGFLSIEAYRIYFKKYLAPFKNIRAFAYRCIKNKFKRPREYGKIYLVQMRNDTDKSRYLDILDRIDPENLFVFNKFIFGLARSHPFGDQSIDFSCYFSPGIFFKSISITMKIQELIRNDFKATSSGQNSNLFYSLVASQTKPQFVKIIMRALLFDRAIKVIKPEGLFLVTSLASPYSRLPASIAHRNKIPVFIVASRAMLSVHRAEDRCCKADIEGYNKTSLGDYFFVRDKFSKYTLLRQKIKNESIYSIDTFDRNIGSIDSEMDYDIHNGIILLLTQYKKNTIIFELIASINIHGFEHIFIRSHPSKKKINKVCENQLNILKSTGLEIIDITDIPMNKLKSIDSIAITANSTSGVDIVQTGAGIVWVPFITEQSLQFVDIMGCLGKVCNSQNDFTDFLYLLSANISKRRQFNKNCSLQYKNSFEFKFNSNEGLSI